MKPPPLAYSAPRTLAELLEVIADQSLEVKVIAGGQSLVPLLNLRLARPDVLVDLAGVEELRAIREDGEVLAIGAGVTQAEAERSDLVRRAAPLLHRALPYIGHPQTRARGTVCGSLAHNDPAAELPAVVLALDAVLRVHSTRGERLVPAASFFPFPFSTVLEPDELLHEVQIPLPVTGRGAGSAFVEMRRRRGDFATVSVACLLHRADDGTVARVAIALSGVGGRPVRAGEVEAGLTGLAVTTAVAAEAGAAVAAGLDPPDDMHASAVFRRELAADLVAAALQDAWKEADDAGARP